MAPGFRGWPIASTPWVDLSRCGAHPVREQRWWGGFLLSSRSCRIAWTPRGRPPTFVEGVDERRGEVRRDAAAGEQHPQHDRTDEGVARELGVEIRSQLSTRDTFSQERERRRTALRGDPF